MQKIDPEIGRQQDSGQPGGKLTNLAQQGGEVAADQCPDRPGERDNEKDLPSHRLHQFGLLLGVNHIYPWGKRKQLIEHIFGDRIDQHAEQQA